MDYVIIVNDNGELKTISATEFENVKQRERLASFIEARINTVLDLRSLSEELAEKNAEKFSEMFEFDAAEHARRERSLFNESDGIPGDAI